MQLENGKPSVTPTDWYRTGFADGRNGSPSWPPTGPASVTARTAYREGYQKGTSERRAVQQR